MGRGAGALQGNSAFGFTAGDGSVPANCTQLIPGPKKSLISTRFLLEAALLMHSRTHASRASNRPLKRQRDSRVKQACTRKIHCVYLNIP